MSPVPAAGFAEVARLREVVVVVVAELRVGRVASRAREAFMFLFRWWFCKPSLAGI